MRAAMSSGGEYRTLVSMSGQMSFNAAPPPSPFHTSLQAPALLRGYIFGNIEFSSAQRSKNISSLGGDTVNDRPLSQAKIVTTKVV